MSQATDFDSDLAGAMLLGKDAAAVCLNRTAMAVTDIISDVSPKDSLINQLLQATLSTGEEATTSRVERFIAAFVDGFRVEAATHRQA